MRFLPIRHVDIPRSLHLRRRVLHSNVTQHPTAEWTIQQFREFLSCNHKYRFLIHDRDAIFSAEVDRTLKGFGLRTLTPPVRTPQANGSLKESSERFVGNVSTP